MRKENLLMNVDWILETYVRSYTCITIYVLFVTGFLMWRRRIIAIGSPPHLRLIKGEQDIIYN